MTATQGDQQPDGRLTPDVVRNAVFPVARHGGYDAPAVNQFLGAAADRLFAAEAEIRRLRQEAEQNQQGVKMDVSAETVNLLSRAQVIADKHVSDAEQYAHDLIDTARQQYTEILQKAEENAASRGQAANAGGTAAGPAQRPEGARDSGPGPAIPEIEYVRTYTRVAQVQLRAVIDALAEQVDQLGHLPGLEPPQPPQASAPPLPAQPPEAPPTGGPQDQGA
ncbi:MAG TPA: DivIVA domain-containing protein [Micrococcaceae bacterium]|jgi:cell division initiation protein|nr:DivIVA domain-containing protein [Micrococcaceae bacterium]